MRQRPNYTSQGLIFVGVCVLLAAVLFFAVRVERVPDRAAAPGSEVAVVAENTYQPEIDAVESGPSDVAALPPIGMANGGDVAEGRGMEATRSADASTVGGSGEPLLGQPIACRGNWSDGVKNGIRISLRQAEDELGSYRWQFEDTLAAQGRFELTAIPTVLQVDAFTYEMTCTDVEAKVVPTGDGANRWDEWKMYRIR